MFEPSRRAGRGPASRRLARGLALTTWVSVALLGATGCDAYECTPQGCDRGGSWSRCIVCGGDSCTYQARSSRGDTLAECTYAQSSTDHRARDACFAQTNGAGANYCAGAPVGTGSGSDDGCARATTCGSCTGGGCAWCAGAGRCVSFASGCPGDALETANDCTLGRHVTDCTVYAPNDPPPGSYGATCRDVVVTRPFNVHAVCSNNGAYGPVDFYFGNCNSRVSNDHGNLVCSHCD